MSDLPLAFVIEDDPNIRTIISEALKGAGFQVTPISNGKDALEELAASVPALVTLDMHMPEVSGPTVLGTIRGDQRLLKTIVIMITGDLPKAEEIAEQADHVLVKPVSFVKLRQLASDIKEGLV